MDHSFATIPIPSAPAKPAGGAVFSTGSITFCGSLPPGNFDNNISRLLENGLRRFLAEGWKGA